MSEVTEDVSGMFESLVEQDRACSPAYESADLKSHSQDG
jgi:hypothetical protein